MSGYFSKVSFQRACVGEYYRINVAMLSNNNTLDYNTDGEVLLGKCEERVGESTREGKDVSFLNLFWFWCYLFIYILMELSKNKIQPCLANGSSETETC
jgi:hypothetical protein